ncbi:DUF4268 domain-containing protein [Gaoshiqia sediminis]|uniref:DUF4268 domain-containing protein n=1 Tax=Gaoshiqia sediminis TaxID=2986998 RepID=A0AA42C5E1_9BACT|nr:DUF4268 domain-containing protein [Gaoshiqia sediminis]MCW0482733.1 DUF4268 domain-containing protein [Gaoshiqia sediminis]
MKIGKLEKVDIRQLWIGEASDFTPWLAKKENMELLGDEIGIELEVVQQEKNVGSFRADILCRSTIDNHNILIENQLEKTDHTHLGQILTYAAGLDAVTIIWIAKKFTEEHRAAIDWLNKITDDKFNFFGIEIEVYRIGDSLPAPFFQIVSKPNDWSKAVKATTQSQELTETKALNLEYWQAMKQYLEDKGTLLKQQKPLPQHWTNFALGKTDIYMAAVASVRDGFIRVELNINTTNAKEQFRILQSKYEELAAVEIGDKIFWNELPDRKVSLVSLEKSVNVADKSNWPEQHQWLLENLEKFDKFFRPKIKNL